MELDYLITIVTKQEVEGEKDVLEVITHASFEGDKDDYIIFYSEEEEDGSKSKTRLHVENGKSITVTREGAITTHLVIEKGVRTVSHHVTPYGSFSMGISSAEISSDMSEEGGTLNFKYSTDVEMAPIGVIEFNITLSKKSQLHS